MVSYLYRMPAGIPGDVSRSDGVTIEPHTVMEAAGDTPPDEYGKAVVLDSATGKIRGVKSADTAIYGFLVRPYPTNAGQEALGVGAPSTAVGAACDVMRRGYMTVRLRTGTAVKGGTVYIWKAAAGGGNVPGGVTATDPTTNGIALSNAIFMGAADADGNVEISFNI